MFISRLVRGGLAESTGLLGVNDEILEVNGIDVAGKSLDQVNTDDKFVFFLVFFLLNWLQTEVHNHFHTKLASPMFI